MSCSRCDLDQVRGGYTGSELLRCLLLRRAIARDIEIVALTSSSRAGRSLGSVLPQFSGVALPVLSLWEDVDWGGVSISPFARCRTARRRR